MPNPTPASTETISRALREPSHHWTVIWFTKDNHVQSFRWRTEHAKHNKATYLAAGYSEIPDPFRKGAPHGGYPTHPNLLLTELPTVVLDADPRPYAHITLSQPFKENPDELFNFSIPSEQSSEGCECSLRIDGRSQEVSIQDLRPNA